MMKCKDKDAETPHGFQTSRREDAGFALGNFLTVFLDTAKGDRLRAHPAEGAGAGPCGQSALSFCGNTTRSVAELGLENASGKKNSRDKLQERKIK
jgi:hypothetical protein